jgi:AI-2 transport protein TqsA
MVNESFRTLVYGVALALMVGWVLHIGQDIFIPIVFSILVVYVILGLTRLLARIPVVGPALPVQIRYSLSIVLIAVGLILGGSLLIASKERVVALAPQYQHSMLAAIQSIAVYFQFETEPTWATLRQEFLAQVNIQRLIGSMVASVSSIVVSILVVFLFASFLLLEQRAFGDKIASISKDPRSVARILGITSNINAQIGSYLALKTFIGILLGALSWMVMAYVGLELAGFWAVLIALLNYVPYIGSFAGVLFPVVIAIIQFGNVNDVLAVLVPLAIVQFLIGNFLDPYLMGRSLNMSPFVILISLAVWSALWGIPGAFLAVPLTAIMTIVFSEFAGTRPLAVLLSRSGRI